MAGSLGGTVAPEHLPDGHAQQFEIAAHRTRGQVVGVPVQFRREHHIPVRAIKVLIRGAISTMAVCDLASGIGELFPTIAALEGLREEGGVDSEPFGKAMLGEFRILRELGRGGMGVVYLAEQPSLARRVALKVLPSSFARDANLRTRFQREARVVAGMSHPNITPVFAVGDRRVVFARRERSINPVVGFTQGLMRIAPDASGIDRVFTLERVPIASAESIGRQSSGATVTAAPMPLSELRARISRALVEARRQ